MNKAFYRSKEFWTFVSGIVTASGSLLIGEVTFEKVIVTIVLDVLGILGIIFRWNSETDPLGWSGK